MDFLAADAHKWLLGPCGAGVLYVRHEVQDRLNPPIYGWHNVQNPNFVAQEQIVFRSGALKYEAGTHNLVGLVGLIAAMELALEIGVENIAAELLRKRAWLVPALQAKGFTVLNADAKPENASGIVSFHQPAKIWPRCTKNWRRPAWSRRCGRTARGKITSGSRRIFTTPTRNCGACWNCCKRDKTKRCYPEFARSPAFRRPGTA